MREIVEFRVDERYAPMLFAPHEGQRVGFVRKIELETSDPRYQRVGELQAKIERCDGELLYFSSNIRRIYSPAELAAAELLHLRVTSVFEPAGEECGTKYDESAACQHCGAGAKQIGPLILDVGRIPKGKDIAKTIPGEIVVSERVAELFDCEEVSGAELRPVEISRPVSANARCWYQVVVKSADAVIVPPTRAGIDPFDDDLEGEYRCSEGDLIGLNILSEVSISADSRGRADIVVTRQFVGVRRGLLRPEREILISPKLYRLIESEKLKGCRIEVAHLA